MNLLELLKRIEWTYGAHYHDYGDLTCPACDSNQNELVAFKMHTPGCELKAAIDRLEHEKITEGSLTQLDQRWREFSRSYNTTKPKDGHA